MSVAAITTSVVLVNHKPMVDRGRDPDSSEPHTSSGCSLYDSVMYSCSSYMLVVELPGLFCPWAVNISSVESSVPWIRWC